MLERFIAHYASLEKEIINAHKRAEDAEKKVDLYAAILTIPEVREFFSTEEMRTKLLQVKEKLDTVV